MRIISKNKKAFLDYEIKEKIKAGIVLLGFEVKSIKTKGIDLTSSYITFLKGEPFLINAKIFPYQPGNTPQNWDSKQARKILLKKREIEYLKNKRKTDKLTIIPLEVFEDRRLIKLTIALAKHRKKYEKKEKIKERETKKRIERTLKEKQKLVR